MGELINFDLGTDMFRTEHHNKNVELIGRVKIANNVTPELVNAVFKCVHCGTIHNQAQGGGKCKLLHPEACSNKDCTAKKPRFEFLQDRSQFLDYQAIWLQPIHEPRHKLGRGQKVILKKGLVGAKEGETISVRGKLSFELKGRTNFAIPVVIATKIKTLDKLKTQ